MSNNKYNIEFESYDDNTNMDLNIHDNLDDHHPVSKKYNKVDTLDLVVNIFDLIKNCQTEMVIPLFDKKNFGYFQIQEYLETLGIK
jgi:hypothetical protein